GVKTEYDAQGRLVKLIDGAGNAVPIVYDPDHSLETVRDALGNPTTFEYDAYGNVVREVNALGGVTLRTYDDFTLMTGETDALGRTTAYTYDAAGNLLTTTDPLGQVTRTTYSMAKAGLFGRLTFGSAPVYNPASTTDALGNTTTYIYATNSSLTGLGA